MTDRLMSVPQMARELGMVENTVRRYTNRFSDVFVCEVTGGVRQYPAELLAVISRIAELYGQGKKKHEIGLILEQEFEKPECTVAGNDGAETGADPLIGVLQGLRQSMDNIGEQLRELTDTIKAR